MIFLLILYHLFLHVNVLAGPLPLSPPTSETPFTPGKIIDPNKFTQRSEWNIVWSCFATIFSCSWVAIHPNIPAPSDSSRRIFFRRLMIMLYMLYTPEYVILWAARQWYAARDIANKHKDRGWTSRTHGFFALMGGFMLYDNGVMIETLSIERLEELESEGRINWPSISEKEIEDRSKGDVFSKSFAILQTTWFVTQCIARRVYGLVITELEVTTLAFAVLNVILYFLWWNKPLGATCPVPVHLISSKPEPGTQATDSNYAETPDYLLPQPLSDSPCTLNMSPSSNDEELSHPLTKEEPGMRATDSNYAETPDHPLCQTLSDSPCTLNLSPSSDNEELSHPHTKKRESTPLEPIPLNSFQHLFKAFERGCAELRFVFSEFFSRIDSMNYCTTIHGSLALSVPTFYAPLCGATTYTKDTRSIFIGGMVGTLFGGTHCIASSFPSIEEKYLWRASAAAITSIPIAFISIAFLRISASRWFGSWSVAWSVNCIVQLFVSPICFGDSVFETITGSALAFCSTVYFFSRVALLILPLIALRSLPSGSLVDIKWSSFIPHI